MAHRCYIFVIQWLVFYCIGVHALKEIMTPDMSRSKKFSNLTNHQATQQNSVKDSESNKMSFFVTENYTVVVAQVGSKATLPCMLKKSCDGVVTWIRKRDYRLLTVSLQTHNADDRFLVEHNNMRHLQNWDLLIKNVQLSDAGVYECQISMHPPSSIIVELKVTKAIAEIQGSPDLYLQVGSLLKLVCTLQHSTEVPSYVFWYQAERMINYDKGLKVIDDHFSSVLMIEVVNKSHSGNYTCSPSNTVPASINVYVLDATSEEKSAAMQEAGSVAIPSTNSSLLMMMVSICFHTRFFRV